MSGLVPRTGTIRPFALFVLQFLKLTGLVQGTFIVMFPIAYFVWWELGLREARSLFFLALDQIMSH